MLRKNIVKNDYNLEEILTKQQIEHIIRKATNQTNYELICSEVRPASEGLTGFLGDHMKAVLHVKLNDDNQKKTDVDVQILHEMGEIQGPNPWCEKAFLYTESMLVTAELLDTFSKKYTKKIIPDLELKLTTSFIEICDSFDVANDTLNVLVDKDLWNNNIMFKYEDGKPINAILIDFQCIKYGPPAYDIMLFLYLTTSRQFREKYEHIVFNYYFRVFMESLDDATKKVLDKLGYDEKDFLY